MNAPPIFNIDLIRDTSNTNNERPKWIQIQKLKTIARFWCPLFAFMMGHLIPKPPECQGRVLYHYSLLHVGYRFGHRGELLFYRSTVRMCDVHTAYQVVKSLRKAMTHNKIHRRTGERPFNQCIFHVQTQDDGYCYSGRTLRVSDGSCVRNSWLTMRTPGREAGRKIPRARYASNQT